MAHLAYDFKFGPKDIGDMTASDLFFWADRLNEIGRETKGGKG